MEIFTKYLVLSIFLASSSMMLLNAQEKNSNRPLRIEIEVKSNEEPFTIAPVGENGVLIFYASTIETEAGKRVWVFILYDRNFEKIWTKEVILFEEMDYLDYGFDSKSINLLFASIDKSSYDNFQIVVLQYLSNDDNQITGSLPRKSVISSFFNYNGLAFLGLNHTDNMISMYVIDLDSLTIKEYPVNLKEEASVADMKINSFNGNIDLLAFNNRKKSRGSLIICEIDKSGNITKSADLIPENKGFSFNTARIIAVNVHYKLISGTYNNNAPSRSKSGNLLKETATGMFVAPLHNGKPDSVRYYNFTDFKNFYMYFTDAMAMRIKKRAVKREESGKKLNMNYRLLVHDFIQNAGEYIMVTEAFKPEYRTVTSMTYDVYGRPMPTSYTVFEGYRYTNAFIAAFDSSGMKLWDNTFQIYNILDYNLKERINLILDGNEIVMAYNFEGEITSKIIRGSEVIEGQDKTQIETLYQTDKVVSDYSSDMDYWYGNYFLCYGYQKIKNNSLIDQNKRTVFYLNKIVFH